MKSSTAFNSATTAYALLRPRPMLFSKIHRTTTPDKFLAYIFKYEWNTTCQM